LYKPELAEIELPIVCKIKQEFIIDRRRIGIGENVKEIRYV